MRLPPAELANPFCCAALFRTPAFALYKLDSDTPYCCDNPHRVSPEATVTVRCEGCETGAGVGADAVVPVDDTAVVADDVFAPLDALVVVAELDSAPVPGCA